MNNEKIKEAFLKVREDMDKLRSEFLEIKELLRSFQDDINTLKLHEIHKENEYNPEKNTSTLRQITSTHPVASTHSSTVPLEVEGLKPPNLGVSTGNEGASTDRQTDRQTDNSTQNQTHNPQERSIETNIREASEILDSLDTIKRDIRLKFKHLTAQEMAVFSTIYQLEEQNFKEINYKQLSKNLKLSESSVRDYVQRMINKGIPIKKQKVNNKKVLISISSELKKIASLPTIIQLRDL